MAANYPFCKSCGLFSLCLGNPLDAIKASNAYLCPICEQVYVNGRPYPWSAVCGQFYGVLVRVKRVSICTDAKCAETNQGKEYETHKQEDGNTWFQEKKKEGKNEQGDNE